MVDATVVITTRNRKEDLAKAVGSALAQKGSPRVLIMDDGSTDGTREMVEREFPEVRLETSGHSLGYIRQRNRAAQLARTPVIFSIDDDAVFSTPNIVADTLGDFDHPRVGAVAIPSIDVNRNLHVARKAPDRRHVYAAYCYVGTAHALRRDLFLGLSGYREILVHQGEEEDFCLRLLDAGYFTRSGNADPIHHFESPRRSWVRMDFYGARNKVLYAWQNVPFPAVTWHLCATTAMTLTVSLRPGRFWTRLRGVVSAYLLCCRRAAGRRPVKLAAYRLSRQLKHRGAVPLQELEPWLHRNGTVS